MEAVDQRLVFTGSEHGKVVELKQMIADGLPAPCLVFVQSRQRAEQLYDQLTRLHKLPIDRIHSDRSAKQVIRLTERKCACRLSPLKSTANCESVVRIKERLGYKIVWQVLFCYRKGYSMTSSIKQRFYNRAPFKVFLTFFCSVVVCYL